MKKKYIINSILLSYPVWGGFLVLYFGEWLMPLGLLLSPMSIIPMIDNDLYWGIKVLFIIGYVLVVMSAGVFLLGLAFLMAVFNAR